MSRRYDLRMVLQDAVEASGIGESEALCVWRVLKRLAQYRNTTRPEMAAGCPEHFSLKFLLWIWNYRRRTRPKIVGLLSQCAGRVKVIRLQSAAEIDRYLRALATLH